MCFSWLWGNREPSNQQQEVSGFTGFLAEKLQEYRGVFGISRTQAPSPFSMEVLPFESTDTSMLVMFPDGRVRVHKENEEEQKKEEDVVEEEKNEEKETIGGEDDEQKNEEKKHGST